MTSKKTGIPPHPLPSPLRGEGIRAGMTILLKIKNP